MDAKGVSPHHHGPIDVYSIVEPFNNHDNGNHSIIMIMAMFKFVYKLKMATGGHLGNTKNQNV